MVTKKWVKRKVWTAERVLSELHPLIEKHGRMPSASEMREAGRNDLACAISRNGGFRHWASIASTKMKPSDTLKGQIAEDNIASYLEDLGAKVIRQKTKAPYDLLVNGHQIDVKSAIPSRYGKSWASTVGWIFRIGKDHTCDYYLLICYDKERQNIIRRYLVPSEAAPTSMLTITPHNRCKYDPYRDNLAPIL